MYNFILIQYLMGKIDAEQVEVLGHKYNLSDDKIVEIINSK